MAIVKDSATGKWKTSKAEPAQMQSAPDHNWYWNNSSRASGQGKYYQTAYQNLQRGWAGMIDPRVYEDLNNIFNQDKANYEKELAEYNQENTKATTRNKAEDLFSQVRSSTMGGDYVKQRDILKNTDLGLESAGFSKAEADSIKNTLLSDYKTFYINGKDKNGNPFLVKWPTELGAKTPLGDFTEKEAAYYKTQSPNAAKQWDLANKDDNVDIVLGYGTENAFYHWHYTSIGKPAGVRAHEIEKLTAAEQYVEQKPTDKDLQDVKSIQLGLKTDTQTDRLLKVPEIADAWEKAKAGDTYWKNLGKQYFLDPAKEDEFSVLFRMSDRPEDKAVSFQYNINAGYGITALEDALNQAVGEKAIVDVKRFGALTQNVLKETIEEMKKAKAKEQEIAIFSGFDSFAEINNINQDLTNSILGDSGVGGVLSFMGGKKTEESLEKSLRGITGINNEVTYNWQQWFDNTLKTKYQEDLELGLTTEEAEERVKIQGQFARDFIDKYLIPRFNESRSMNEFVEYLDVRESEQNPFQTQHMLSAVKDLAVSRSEVYYDLIKSQMQSDRLFDPEFYFNPTGDKAREQQYLDQASTVAADWESAKKGDPYWKSQAYRFSVDVNDKDAFARMHFQVKGQGQGYDPAENFLTASKVNDEIYTRILPALKEKALKQETIFGQFIKPEEFADEMLKGLNPDDKTTWDKVLSKYGLDEFSGDINQLKDYITEALRTGSAQEIREQIKYLNEKKEKPTQEILGVTYIQREEDYKPTGTGEETELYKIFQSAGFQGTEDEFYTDFFPDLDRSEQVALTKAGTNEALKTTGLDFSDPFASLGTIESFFGETDQEEEPTKSSYFTIDEDEDLPTKSKAGQGFLDEFTSLFKGFG
jgi:hypothetical protein